MHCYKKLYLLPVVIKLLQQLIKKYRFAFVVIIYLFILFIYLFIYHLLLYLWMLKCCEKLTIMQYIVYYSPVLSGWAGQKPV